jgi:hypothetical protein
MLDSVDSVVQIASLGEKGFWGAIMVVNFVKKKRSVGRFFRSEGLRVAHPSLHIFEIIIIIA